MYGVINALSMCSPKIKSLYVFGISIFEKWNGTVESNRSADQVRKKRPPSYFACRLDFKLAMLWTCSVQMEFFMSEKTSGQTNRSANNDKNSSAFLSCHGRLVFKLFL